MSQRHCFPFELLIGLPTTLLFVVVVIVIGFEIILEFFAGISSFVVRVRLADATNVGEIFRWNASAIFTTAGRRSL